MIQNVFNWKFVYQVTREMSWDLRASQFNMINKANNESSMKKRSIFVIFHLCKKKLPFQCLELMWYFQSVWQSIETKCWIFSIFFCYLQQIALLWRSYSNHNHTKIRQIDSDIECMNEWWKNAPYKYTNTRAHAHDEWSWMGKKRLFALLVI